MIEGFKIGAIIGAAIGVMCLMLIGTFAAGAALEENGFGLLSAVAGLTGIILTSAVFIGGLSLVERVK